MANIEQKCLNCNKSFITSSSYVKRGFGKYCSRSCSSKHTAKRMQHIPNTECSYCKKLIYRCKSQKEARNFHFCSRQCKDKAQSLSSGDLFSDMRPSHYDDGLSSYRKNKLNATKELKCEVCNYNKRVEILEVHHIDRNRENNEISNLQLLCPNCHREEHFIHKDGHGWWRQNPLNLIK